MDGKIEIAGMWEIGRNVPIMEADQWRVMLRSFGIQNLNMVPVTGYAHDKQWLEEFNSMHDILERFSHLTFVFVDEEGETELKDFEHPENAIYIFGRSNYSPFINMSEGHKSVRIDCIKPGMFWAHQAAAIILRDRFIK